MSIESKVLDLYCDNLVAYYQFHAIHINVVGRNFVSDHKLLDKVYSDAQEHIDSIGEILRTLQVKVPATLASVIAGASIQEQDTEDYTADEMLAYALDLTDNLIGCYRELIEECGTHVDCQHISNFAQDRISTHEKLAWMLRSTLE